MKETLIKKLEYFINRINSFNESNNDFTDLVSIEIFNFIKENPILYKEFKNRACYFIALTENNDASKAQAQIIKKTVEILDLTNETQVKKMQETFKEKKYYFRNSFKNQSTDEKTKYDDRFLSYLEAYNIFKDRDNYYLIGEGQGNYNVDDSYITKFIPINCILNQYESINHLFNKLNNNIFVQEKTTENKYKTLIQNFNELFLKIRYFIKEKSISLKTISFEKMYSYCAGINPQEDFQDQFTLGIRLFVAETMPFNDIKKCSINVLQELIFHIETKGKQNSHNNLDISNLKYNNWQDLKMKFINTQDVIIYDKKNNLFNSTFDLMGFVDGRTTNPDKQWNLIMQFSENNGCLSKNNYKGRNLGKTIELLNKKLIGFFKLNDKPICYDDKTKEYSIKIKLIPEADDKEYLKEKLEIEYFDELAKS
ncbi:hypothetical protein OAR19_00105 [bacterium]|nr:hypothetical protein [bacterium]